MISVATQPRLQTLSKSHSKTLRARRGLCALQSLKAAAHRHSEGFAQELANGSQIKIQNPVNHALAGLAAACLILLPPSALTQPASAATVVSLPEEDQFPSFFQPLFKWWRSNLAPPVVHDPTSQPSQQEEILSQANDVMEQLESAKEIVDTEQQLKQQGTPALEAVPAPEETPAPALTPYDSVAPPDGEGSAAPETEASPLPSSDSTDSTPSASEGADGTSAPDGSSSILLAPDEPTDATPGSPLLQSPDSTAAGSSTGSGRSAIDLLISEEEAQRLPQLPTSFPQLGELMPIVPEEITLSNGLRVMLLEDHEVPLIRGSLLIKGGQYAAPNDKLGIASLSMSVQRSGGSVSHPSRALDARLEELAAAVEAGAGAQAFTLDFLCGSEDVEEVVGLFSEVLREPALPSDRVQIYKEQVTNLLEHQNDNPEAVARRELQKMMYGKTSLYARTPKIANIAALDVQDARQFLATWERPDNAIMGVVGDFDPKSMAELLERDLGLWRPAPDQPPVPPQVVRDSDPLAPGRQVAGRVFLVNRPGLAQAAVAAGEPGVMLSDPDVYSLDVLSTSLNSFGGRLFDQIRTREGLAYSVYGSWESPPDHPGLFVAGGETSSPGEFITSLRRVLQQATAEPLTEAELNAAKGETLNSFVFNFASRGAQLQRKLVYDLLGLPPDQLFRYKTGIGAVKQEDVLAAASRRLHPSDGQVTVVVGDAQKVRPQLESAGLVVEPLELDPI